MVPCLLGTFIEAIYDEKHFSELPCDGNERFGGPNRGGRQPSLFGLKEGPGHRILFSTELLDQRSQNDIWMLHLRRVVAIENETMANVLVGSMAGSDMLDDIGSVCHVQRAWLKADYGGTYASTDFPVPAASYQRKAQELRQPRRELDGEENLRGPLHQSRVE